MGVSRKKEIEADFIKKRLIGVLPTYFLIRILAVVLLKKYELGIIYTLLYLLSLKEPAWFVVEIIIIYFIFYFAKKYGMKHAIFYIFIALLAISILFWILDFEARWYNANLNFGFGMLLAKYRKKYIHTVTKNELRFWLISIGMIIMFGVTAIAFTVFKGNMWANIFKLLAGGFFSLCLVNASLKVKMRSKGLLYVGKYSLQIYLLHIVVIEWFGQRLNGDTNLIIIFLLELVISLMGLIAYCWFENKILMKILKKDAKE